MATVLELFKGRSEAFGARSWAEIPYVVFDAANEAAVKAAAEAEIEEWYGDLYLKSIEIQERINATTWRLVARYEPPDPSEKQTLPDPVVAFDSTGGTQHITQSLQTVGIYGPAGSNNLGGAIGYDGERVAGCDIVVPVWNWSETHYKTSINQSAYYALTGKVNSGSFRGFSTGEVLFLGATGQKRGGIWEVTFKFAASPNKSGITIGGITNISKKGWEYLWVQYGDAVDTNVKVRIKKPVAVYVEKVYESGDFSQLGISG
ncbi:MAG: hypothetical protein N3A38_14050 [Planctomycetota bacterium]|nr:hypothetical protein [Planctomycetota bacterium]